MKNNKVRMELSRDMHNWFKGIDAKTNDERMQRVIEVNNDYKELLGREQRLNEMLHGYRELSKEAMHKSAEVVFLKYLLAASCMVSFVSIVVIYHLLGWLS